MRNHHRQHQQSHRMATAAGIFRKAYRKQDSLSVDLRNGITDAAKNGFDRSNVPGSSRGVVQKSINAPKLAITNTSGNASSGEAEIANRTRNTPVKAITGQEESIPTGEDHKGRLWRLSQKGIIGQDIAILLEAKPVGQ